MDHLLLATEVDQSEGVAHGDIFYDVRYSYIETETDEGVEVIEYSFPSAIIVSQPCDVYFMDQALESKNGKSTKFMPCVLMCPIYDEDKIRAGEHIVDADKELSLRITKERLFNSDVKKTINLLMHCRFHPFHVINSKNKHDIIKDSYIDFKHCFSVPLDSLRKIRNRRICRLESIYAELITVKFCSFMSRIGTEILDDCEEA